MRIAQDRLNAQALTLEEAQTEIRRVVKNGYFLSKAPAALNNEIARVIDIALKKITIPSLREAARRSLIEYYNRQMREIRQVRRQRLLTLLALFKLSERRAKSVAGDSVTGAYTANMSIKKARELVSMTLGEDVAKLYGVPLQKYSENYFKENVKPTLDQMAQSEALDPDSESYWGRRSTLRNRAEREVRYQGHIDNVEELRARGVKLVIISAHADCSERCRPFQGRVFSLDGTSGTTPDGRAFEPIENATDIYTPNGKWKNGLFGFNCRHYAVEYKDSYRFPMPSAKVERKEYAITVKQRQMEREVRFWRARAEMYSGVSRDEYQKARDKAKEWNKRYIDFSRKNNRAYYPSRTRLI